MVGVIGGIPTVTNIFCDVTAAIPGTNIVAVPNDNLDDGPALQAAISRCGSNQVVHVPAGHYVLSNSLSMIGNGVVLRGVGTNTVFHPNVTASQLITVGRDSNEQYERSIASGYTKGSTNIALFDASNYSAGKYVRLWTSNETWVHNAEGRLQQLCYVRAVSGTNLSIWPPVVFSFSEALSPKVAIHSFRTAMVGVENLKIEHTNANCTGSIMLDEVDNCWIKGVESASVPSKHFYLNKAINCEIRECYLHEAFNYGNNAGYGYDLANKCTGVLVENNAAYMLFPAYVLGDAFGGVVGCVVAYNYSYRPANQTGWNLQVPDFGCNHGEHNMFNLFEGNIGTGFQSDSYHGSASHTVVFRNHWTAYHPDWTGNAKAVDICRWSYWFSLVGNVLGTTNFSGTYENFTNDYSLTYNTIYRLGYPNMGNNAYSATNPPTVEDTALDLYVVTNLLRHGNYDYVSSAVRWADGITNRTFPDSLYLTSKPTWFSNATWPPVVSTTPSVALLPAQMRYLGLDYSNPPATNAPSRRAGRTVNAISVRSF